VLQCHGTVTQQRTGGGGSLYPLLGFGGGVVQYDFGNFVARAHGVERVFYHVHVSD
jgi:hypothetical protein